MLYSQFHNNKKKNVSLQNSGSIAHGRHASKQEVIAD